MRSGCKGDFDFRETDNAGTEIVSIMFERKHEIDRTSTKNRNEDFRKELERDCGEKGFESAVRVSLLEPDSELCNTRIVDVFHRDPTMYVVRPQLFIPIITRLRNVARNSLKYKMEQAPARAQNIDPCPRRRRCSGPTTRRRPLPSRSGSASTSNCRCNANAIHCMNEVCRHTPDPRRARAAR